jgi:hypothetical protein
MTIKKGVKRGRPKTKFGIASLYNLENKELLKELSDVTGESKSEIIDKAIAQEYSVSLQSVLNTKIKRIEESIDKKEIEIYDLKKELDIYHEREKEINALNEYKLKKKDKAVYDLVQLIKKGTTQLGMLFVAKKLSIETSIPKEKLILEAYDTYKVLKQEKML